MTLDVPPAGSPADRPDPERPADPRPAWERIAYVWLAREVDAGQPVDPASLADEVSVAPASPATWSGCCVPTASATRSSWSCAAGWSATSSPTPT